MSTTTQLTTADELLAMPDDGFRYELVEGELKRMSPAGHNHGRIAMRLAAPLGKFVADNNLGAVYAAETGFKLKSDPDTVRAPDASFIRQERVEQVGDTEGFWPGAPDLAVEVNSPGDTVNEVEQKVQEWLSAGARLVWVVSPKLRVVTIYRSLADIVTLTEKDTLDGGEVVPGFQFPVAELFVL
ncbi:MAG TPA: Uma2 family endonuclease [Pyrinomonadaceae bacterium]|nr:Uma2 family endonuclease [Pyrinomonadaceae bacterium]